MLKEKWKFFKKCSHYRVPGNLNTGGIVECDRSNQTECLGEIQFCKNLEVLNEYLLKRGFGWQKKKGSNRFKRALQGISRWVNACRSRGGREEKC